MHRVHDDKIQKKKKNSIESSSNLVSMHYSDGIILFEHTSFELIKFLASTFSFLRKFVTSNFTLNPFMEACGSDYGFNSTCHTTGQGCHASWKHNLGYTRQRLAAHDIWYAEKPLSAELGVLTAGAGPLMLHVKLFNAMVERKHDEIVGEY
ncbi:hypothetical protein RJ641_026232 [Dillenia turbinata]|uniref:Uncharacterized protein n=1 Tax=Dillenia turbinata TaxID=194707 RepID=A0AAN8W4D7_9MAGN